MRGVKEKAPPLHARDFEKRSRWTFGLRLVASERCRDGTVEKRIDTAVLARIDRHRPVFVIGDGPDAQLSVAPQLIFRLIEAGVTVRVLPLLSATYGGGREYRPGADVTTIAIASGKAHQPSGPGELISFQPFGPGRTKQFDELAAERTALLNSLVASVRGAKVELTPGIDARIKRVLQHIADLLAPCLQRPEVWVPLDRSSSSSSL